MNCSITIREKEELMKSMTTNGRTRLRIAIPAAVLVLTLGLAFKPLAQGGGSTQPTTYKLTVKDGERSTPVKLTAAQGKITAVSGMRDGRTFNFKHLRAGEKSKIKGGSDQTRKCAGLTTDSNLKWTFCFYVSGGSNQTAAIDFFLELEGIKGESKDDAGGGGGGGEDSGGSGTPPTCWEDEKLQMSICDP